MINSIEVVTGEEFKVYGWIYLLIGTLFLFFYVKTLAVMGEFRRIRRCLTRIKSPTSGARQDPAKSEKME